MPAPSLPAHGNWPTLFTTLRAVGVPRHAGCGMEVIQHRRIAPRLDPTAWGNQPVTALARMVSTKAHMPRVRSRDDAIPNLLGRGAPKPCLLSSPSAE
jgi:hypothetical protein